MDERLKEILPLVSKPGRYTGGEANSVRKDLNAVSLRVALAFPDLYEIGISNLGLQILYHILNGKDHIAAERVYAPWGDMEKLLRENDVPLASLESSMPLADFDIVGFSLQHELAYTNVLNMLDLGGIPLLSSERNESDPLVIAGGPSTFNPEPAAEFFDAFLIGDGEEALLEICDLYLKWREQRGGRGELLTALSGIEGVYVPSLFSFEYTADGKIKKMTPLKSGYEKVNRRLLTDIDSAPYPTMFILPNVRPVHDRVALEVARGCSRFCRFCQAGYIYLPVRERSPERIREIGDRALMETGNDRVALLSLSTGDYSCLEGLLPDLARRYKEKNTALTFPSLRVDTITAPIMEEIRKVKSSGFTIAPEAGSQRLRDLINKGVTEKQILDTVREISRGGWQSVKLYFMIGLPTETRDDLDEIARLAEVILRTGRKEGGIKKITVNISTFVPKPHTPFQWERQNSLEETREKLSHLKKRLKNRNISLKWQEPGMSILEGVFSRGDRRLGKSVLDAFERGCRFDAWGDKMDFSLWQDAFETTGIEPDAYLRGRETDELLPWDVVDTGVDKDFLLEELKRSQSGEQTDDCRHARCSACGVCDHKVVKIKTFDGESVSHQGEIRRPKSPLKSRLRVRYAKRGDARFIGHIDTMNAIIRMLRRSGIPVAYSGGFHPSPRVSFSSPIPLGTASLAEYFDVEIDGHITPGKFLESVNTASPSGLDILDAFTVRLKEPSLTESVEKERYTVTVPEEIISIPFLKSCIDKFLQAGEWPAVKKTRKGEKRFDLKGEIYHLAIERGGTVEIALAAKGGRKVKADDALAYILNLSEDEKKYLKVLKTDALFAGLAGARAACA